MLDGDTGELNIVIPYAIVDRIVPDRFRGEGPGKAGRLKDDRKSPDVLRPGNDLARVVEQQNVRPLHIPWDFDFPAGDLLHLLLDELHAVLGRQWVHAGGGPDPEMLNRPLFMELLGGNPHLL